MDPGRMNTHTDPATCVLFGFSWVCLRGRLIETGLGSRTLLEQEPRHS